MNQMKYIYILLSLCMSDLDKYDTKTKTITIKIAKPEDASLNKFLICNNFVPIKN